MAIPKVWRVVYFLPASVFLKRRNKKKNYGGWAGEEVGEGLCVGWGGEEGMLDRENRAGVLENIHCPVHSETMSHFQPCDSWRCHVTNTCLG